MNHKPHERGAAYTAHVHRDPTSDECTAELRLGAETVFRGRVSSLGWGRHTVATRSGSVVVCTQPDEPASGGAVCLLLKSQDGRQMRLASVLRRPSIARLVIQPMGFGVSVLWLEEMDALLILDAFGHGNDAQQAAVWAVANQRTLHLVGYYPRADEVPTAFTGHWKPLASASDGRTASPEASKSISVQVEARQKSSLNKVTRNVHLQLPNATSGLQ